MFWNVIDQTRQSVLKKILEADSVPKVIWREELHWRCCLGIANPSTLIGFLRPLFPPRPLLEDLIVSVDMPKFKMASLLDIGIMKLIAASQRGAKMDIIDLYALEQHGLPIATLLSRLSDKFTGVSVN